MTTNCYIPINNKYFSRKLKNDLKKVPSKTNLLSKNLFTYSKTF